MNDESGDAKPPGKLIQGFSLAVVVLRHRKWRRNLLFGLTLLTLFLVFGGVVVLGDGLMNEPVAFAVFWGICFVLVGLLLMLALLDIMIIRREHQGKVRDLERELAEAAIEARVLAETEKAAAAETDTPKGGDEGARSSGEDALT